jgi:hypothetical protein
LILKLLVIIICLAIVIYLGWLNKIALARLKDVRLHSGATKDLQLQVIRETQRVIITIVLGLNVIVGALAALLVANLFI